MENNKEYVAILERLAEIGADVKGMHRRQDITNGRMAKNEEKIIALEKSDLLITDMLTRLGEESAQRKEDERETAQFWTRKVGERILWASVAVIGVVLTKLGIINIAI